MTNLIGALEIATETITLEAMGVIASQIYGMGLVVATSILGIKVFVVGYQKLMGRDASSAKRQLKKVIVPCGVMYAIPYLLHCLKFVNLP